MTPVKYKNKTYTSITELAREYNIVPSTLHGRLNKGMSLKQAMEYSREIIYKNKTYKNITQLAKAYNIPAPTLTDRINNKHMSIEDAVETPLSKTITYKNKTYRSLTALAKEYNIDYNTVKGRLQKNWSLEKSINTPVKSIYEGNALKYKNKTYRSIRELAKEYNIKHNTLKQRLQKGWSIEKAVETPVITDHNTSGKRIEYNNKIYGSIKALAKDYNINRSLLESRLKDGWSVEEAITTPASDTRKGQTLTYNNKTYTSISKLAKDIFEKYGISEGTLKSRLQRGMTVKEAVETPLIKKSTQIKYKNKTYRSITELAKKYNINHKILRERINKLKWSVEKSIETPINAFLPSGFQKIKLAYTCNNTDYYECLHNNQKYILSIQEMKDFTES